MMETLAHPKRGIKKYGHMVLPVVLGFLGGFVLLAGAIAKLASSEPAIVTSLFVGLIVGTLPQLFRDGAKQGRDKSCYIAKKLFVNQSPQTVRFEGFPWLRN